MDTLRIVHAILVRKRAGRAEPIYIEVLCPATPL